MRKYITAFVAIVSAFIGYQIGLRSRVTEPPTISDVPQKKAHSPEPIILPSERPLSGLDSLTLANANQHLAEVEKLPAGPRKLRAMESFFKKLGSLDGAAAFDLAEALEGRDRLACMSAAATGWASVAPSDAWSRIMEATNNGSTREPELEATINAIASSDIGLAVKLIQQIDNQYTLQSQFQSIIDIAAENGSYAELLGHVQNLEADDKRGYLAEKVFETWGRFELEEPLAALSEISDPAAASKALSGFMRGWAQVDGESAFLYVVDNSSDPKFAELLSSVTEQWVQTSSNEDASSIIDQLGPLKDRDIILSNISLSLVRKQPELTMDAVAAIENDRARSMTTDVAMGQWARTDLEQAASYYRDMPYDGMKQQAFWALFNASMQQSAEPSRIINLAFALEDPAAIDRSLVNMAEYTKVSPFKERSIALKEALLKALDSRQDLAPETRSAVLEKLAPKQPK